MTLIPLPIAGLPASYGNAGLIVTWTAGDASSHNSFTSSGREILIAQNSGITPRILTIKSAPDVPFNRTKDIVDTLAAGEIRVYQMFPSGGWAVGQVIEVDVAHLDLQLLVLRVP